MAITSVSADQKIWNECFAVLCGLRVMPPDLLRHDFRALLTAISVAAGPELTLPPSTPAQVLIDRTYPATIPPPPYAFRLLRLVPATANWNSSFILSCQGEALEFGTEVVWDGFPVITTYISDTEVTAPITLTPGSSTFIPVYLRHPTKARSQTILFTVSSPLTQTSDRGA